MIDLHTALRKTLSPNNDERGQADRILEVASHSTEFLENLLGALRDHRCQFPAIAFLKQLCNTNLALDEKHKVIMDLLSFLAQGPENLASSATKPFLRLTSSVLSICMGSLESACTLEEENIKSEAYISYYNEANSAFLQLFHRMFSNITGGGGVNTNIIDGSIFFNLQLLYLLQELMRNLPLSSFLYQNLSSIFLPMLLNSFLFPSLEANIQCTALSEFFAVAAEVLKEAYERNISKELQDSFAKFFDASWEAVLSSSSRTITNLRKDDGALTRLLHIARFVVGVLHFRFCTVAIVQMRQISFVVQSLLEDTDFFTDLMTKSDGIGPNEMEEEQCILFSFVQPHISCRWSFIIAMMEKGLLNSRNLVGIFGHDENDSMKALFRLILHYSSLSNAEAVKLASDANLFLKEEEERMIDLPITLRDRTLHTCVLGVKTLGARFAYCVVDVIAAVLLAPDHEGGVREREAALFLLYFVLKECRKKRFLKSLASSSSNFSSLLVSITTTIIQRDASHGSNPLQVARALFLLPRVLSFLSLLKVDSTAVTRELAVLCIATLPQLSLSSAEILVKVSTLKCIFNFTSLCTLNELSVVVQNSFPSMTGLLSDPHWEGECLYVVLETMTRLLQTHRRRLASTKGKGQTVLCPEDVRGGLPPLSGIFLPLMECWSLHLADPNIGELIHDVFKELVHCSHLDPTTSQDPSLFSFLQWMGGMLQSKDGGEYIARRISEMLIDLFREPHFVGILAEVAQIVLRPLSELVLSTDFSSLQNSLLKCLTYLLEQWPHSSPIFVSLPLPLMLHCLGEELHSSLHITLDDAEGCGRYAITTVVIATALRLLDPSVREVELLDVKHSIGVLVKRSHEFSHAETAQLVHVLTARVLTVKSSIVAHKLLFPLLILFQHHSSAVVELWMNSGQVDEIFKFWLAQLPLFSSVKNIVTCSCILLSALQDETICSLLSGCFLRDWVVPTSCHSCEEHSEKRRSEAKKISRVSSTKSLAISDRRVEEIPLDAAIFISIGKAILSIAQQWTEGKNGGFFNEDESDDYCSSAEEDDASESEGDDDDNIGEGEKAGKEIGLPSSSLKKRELLMNMHSSFSCLTTSAMSARYGAAASTVLTSAELTVINSFLSSLSVQSTPGM